MSHARLKVHRLNCSCFQGLLVRGRPLACHCLLIETPASGLVLVDTGLGSRDFEAPLSRLTASFINGAQPVIDPSYSALAQIRALGYQASDVRHIVMTHMDLDHVGGLADFPAAVVHLHARELRAAQERRTDKARHRYLPAMWSHRPRFETYDEEGEPWFGMEAVRGLRGLPDDILLVPLFGHTSGHSGVAVQSDGGWILHAGDAYFDRREVHGGTRLCGRQIGVFEAVLDTDRGMRLHNQSRLRRLAAERPEITIMSAHDPFELEEGGRPRAAREVHPDAIETRVTRRDPADGELQLLRAALRAAGAFEEFQSQLTALQVRAEQSGMVHGVEFDVPASPAGQDEARIVADFHYQAAGSLFGFYVYERGGRLAGMQAWSVEGRDAPGAWPDPRSLSPLGFPTLADPMCREEQDAIPAGAGG